MKYLIRFLLLMVGVALTTFGLVYWQSQAFSLDGLLLFDNGWKPHPVHILAIGISLVPPSLWEIFVLESAHLGSAPGPAGDG